MKKLIICLLALVCCFSVKAQTVDIYHGINAGATPTANVGVHAGYYLDLHMRKRLYLFTKYNIHYYNYSPYYDRSRLTLTPSVCFAFRLNGEDKKWNYFPYVGTAINLARYSTGNWIYPNHQTSYFDINLTPSLLVGFEVKYKLMDKYNIGLGVEIDSYEERMRAFVKFGWNRQYKK